MQSQLLQNRVLERNKRVIFIVQQVLVHLLSTLSCNYRYGNNNFLERRVISVLQLPSIDDILMKCLGNKKYCLVLYSVLILMS